MELQNNPSVAQEVPAERAIEEHSKPNSHQLYCISFHDITYEVQQHKHCKRIDNKVILNSVSGLLKPGVNAIMGPTGSGKTSLMDVLADRKHGDGKVRVNRKKRPANYKTLVGYVVQDDVVLGTLSVRENLLFSAALRLPGKTSWKEREERVNKVIDELGLHSCAFTKVGNEFIRGISGGERKRTNIGMELITEPQILFLDEPTSGLDAYTAVSVVQLLKSTSEEKGRTVIMSIHQPRYAIFKLFDSLTLLSKGNIVYQGSSKNSLQYFTDLGFCCDDLENPADFILDILQRSEKEQNTVVYSQQKERGKNFSDIYRTSNEYKELRGAIDPMLTSEQSDHKLKNPRSCFSLYPTSSIWQFWIIARRSGINLFRNPTAAAIQYVTTIFLALVIGSVFLQLDLEATGFQNRIGAIFFIVVSQAFGAFAAVEVFVAERQQFLHEYANGYYRVFPYFITKILVDMGLSRVVPTLVLQVPITYFMIGFQIEAGKFFIFVLVVILTGLIAVSISFCGSVLVGVSSVARILVSTVIVLSMLFSGVLVSLQAMPVWLRWISFLSFLRYATEALSINELDGLTFQCFQDSQNFVSEDCTFDGLERLDELGFESGWLGYDVLALFLFLGLFLLTTFLLLSRLKKDK